MSRTFAPVIAATIALAACLPAMADDSVKGAMMIPVRLVAFTSGAVVGTPIAVVRKVCQNTTVMSGEVSHDSKNPGLRITTAAVMLPFALFKGTLEGGVMGTANSWKYSSEKPFSTDSFSLGEMKED